MWSIPLACSSTCTCGVVLCLVSSSPSNSDEDSPSDEAKALLADVRDQLLQGLADDAENIRYICMFAA